MLTKEAMFNMVKQAGTIKHSCGHTSKCRCSSNHVTEYDTPCWDCTKKAEEEAQEQEQQKTPPGKYIAGKLKDLGSKAGAGAMMLAGGVAAMGKQKPPLKINERY